MPSLYSEYVKERLGQDIVETSSGFITFRISGEICEILDIYVRPDFRRAGFGSQLADQVTELARERGVRQLIGYVWPGTNGADESLKAQLAYGFKLFSCDGGRIILTKEI